MKYEYLVFVTGQLGIAEALDKYSAQGWRLHTLYGPHDQGKTEWAVEEVGEWPKSLDA